MAIFLNFSRMIELFEILERTSSRTDMIDALAKLFKDANPENIGIICYFTLGEITAEYKHITLGMADEMVKSSIAMAADIKEEEVDSKVRDIGDLGDAADELIKKKQKKFQDIFEFKSPITVEDVFRGLMKIAKSKGSGSQELKKKTLAAMLSVSEKKEGKYIVRLVTSEMRLGVGAMTVLDALAVAFLESKEERPELEQAYNVSSDIGHVAKILAKSGIEGVKHIRTAINRPIKPMLAQRVSEFAEIRQKIDSEKIAAEEKYDGERIQAHKDGDKVKLYSRRLTDVSDQFPEVAKNVKNHIDADTAILDGEVVAYDFDKKLYNPFQELMQRRRKYNVEEYAEKVPVKYMLFDVLYVNGKSIMKNSYPERRKRLEEIAKNRKYIAVTNRLLTSDTDKIKDFFEDCINRGLEGVICKSCAKNSNYRAGAREFLWIKWKESYASKLSDNLDLVVVGAYAGKGKRGGTYGALLCAAYNHEEDFFQTLCKLGSGFSDEQLEKLPKKLEKVQTDKKPARVMATDEAKPDVWFEPKFVLEVKGANITRSPIHTTHWDEKEEKGLSLRFPRFVRWRPEKSPDEATTVQEIFQMYSKK
jgi:DNA ligase-1